MRFSRPLSALALVSVVSPVFADVPGSTDVTCDLDRAQFRTAARALPAGSNVTFRLWTDATPGSPDTQIGTDYIVPAADLVVVKRFTEKFDSVAKRKTGRINAMIGSDASPVLLPVDGIAYLDLTVGSTTLGCDLASTGNALTRRRLQSVAFSRESNHSETCETCTTSTDISARVFNSTDIPIPCYSCCPGCTTVVLPFDSERWDTAGIHDPGQPDRLTAPVAGKYFIYGHIRWQSSAAGTYRIVDVRVNGIGGSVIVSASNAPTSGFLDQNVATHFELQAGEFVVLTATQDSGGTLNVTSPGQKNSPEFGMVKLP
jgi:hypothetical protein